MKIDSDILDEHYSDPYHHGVCENATHSGEAKDSEGNCSIVITMSVSEAGEIDEAWFDGEGCEVCEGFASLLCEHIEGKATEELLTAGYRRQWLVRLEGAGLGHRSCLQLPLNALHSALKPDNSIMDEAGQTEFGGPSLREEQ